MKDSNIKSIWIGVITDKLYYSAVYDFSFSNKNNLPAGT